MSKIVGGPGRPLGQPKSGGAKKGMPQAPSKLLPMTASEKVEERVRIRTNYKLMPLDYLMQVLNDESADREIRMQAAQAAAPYLHARLSSIEVKQDAPFVQEVRFTVIEGIAREIEEDEPRLRVQ